MCLVSGRRTIKRGEEKAGCQEGGRTAKVSLAIFCFSSFAIFVELISPLFRAEEVEAENERLREEEEKRRKEEQARREEEEYRKLVESFTVEGEGCDVADDEEEENLLEKFVNHIKVIQINFRFICSASCKNQHTQTVFVLSDKEGHSFRRTCNSV